MSIDLRAAVELLVIFGFLGLTSLGIHRILRAALSWVATRPRRARAVSAPAHALPLPARSH